MSKPNAQTDHAQVLIHDLILAVQSSLDIAEETARKHYSFSVAELEVSASFDFEMTEQDSDVPEDKPQPKHWFSLFGRNKGKNDTAVRSREFSEKDTSQLKVRMLFRPGGKLLVTSTASGSQQETPPEDASTASSGQDSSSSEPSPAPEQAAPAPTKKKR